MDPVRLACVRHAASVRPEPGSNSPSRSPQRPGGRYGHRRAGLRALGSTLDRLAQHGFWLLSVTVLHYCCGSTADAPKRARDRPHWLLALTVPFSRSDAAHAEEASMPGARGRSPDLGLIMLAACAPTVKGACASGGRPTTGLVTIGHVVRAIRGDRRGDRSARGGLGRPRCRPGPTRPGAAVGGCRRRPPRGPGRRPPGRHRRPRR